MFCPLCKAEYREGFTRCKDCNVDLVAALEEPHITQTKAVPVILWRGANPVIFSALVAALQEADIPSYQYPPVDYDNWLSAPQPSVLEYGVPNFDVRVLDRDLEQARAILRELLTQLEAPSDMDATTGEADQ